MRIIRILKVKSTGDNRQRNFEDYNQSIEKVLIVASEIGALVEKTDISIAHRSPAKISNARPMIVRLCRQLSMVELLQKEKNLNQSQSMSSVKVFEDSTAPRLKFFNLMKQDGRFESTSTRQESIFYQT